MNNSDKSAFAELMVGNGEIYNKTVSKSLMQIYFDALTDYSIEDVKKGFGKHSLDAKHGSFFPKPADIVRHLQTGQLSTEEKAELAWGQITYELRKTGSYGNLELDDKQALAALRSFTSWKEFCAMDVTKLTWAKKEFMSMYSTYQNTPLEMLPSSLPGLVELQHHKKQEAQSMQNLLQGMDKFKAKQLNN
ncbi:MAG: hypothetical protein GY804_11420 [Alphaproteobacteria bacterium]|nr:hypothetical protein [Alphaproteobacteria bacterium]